MTNNKISKFRCDIWKNHKEILWMDVPLEFIDKITYKYNDVSEFTLKVPMKVNGELNPYYSKIKSRQQVIITSRNGTTKQRFIICNKVGNYSKTNSSDKTFTCYSFEETLKKKRISVVAGNYYLSKTETYSQDGLLDIIKEKSGWNLGYVEELAQKSDEETEERNTLTFQAITKTNVQYEDIIYSNDVNITSTTTTYGKNPIFIDICYKNCRTESFTYDDVFNSFDVCFYKDIKHIEVKYHSEAGNRFALSYKFTYSDDTDETIVKTFINCTNETLQMDGFTISYTTGNMIKMLMPKFPYMDSYDDNIYSLLSNIGESYFVRFQYDTINKIIHCFSKESDAYCDINEDGTYTLKSYERGLDLSMDSNCISLSSTENVEIPTAIKVIGKGTGDSKQVSIAEYNPYGGDTLYDYKYYIDNQILSDECIEALVEYKRVLELRQDTWEEMRTKSLEIANSSISYESQLISLNDKIMYTQDLLSTYIKVKDSVNQALIKAELDGYTTQLNTVVLARTSLEAESQLLSDQMLRFSSESMRENIKDESDNPIFTEDDLEEMNNIDEVIPYSDDYCSTNYSLYQASLKVLADKVKPSVDFKIDSSNMTEYLKLNNNLIKEGCLYYLDSELALYLAETQVRLTQLEYIPKEDRINGLSYSNKEKKSSALKGGSTTKKVNAVSNTLNSFMKTLSDAQFSNNYVSKVMEDGLNLATSAVNGRGSSNILDFSRAGCFIKDAITPDNQLYFGSGLLAFSSDGFATSSLAISKEGVWADVLVGRILLGQSLVIESDDGCFEIKPFTENPLLDQFGMKIYNKVGSTKTEKIFIGTELKDGVRVAIFRITGKNGEVVISEDGLLQTNSDSGHDNLDSLTPMTIPIYISEGTNRIDSALIRIKCERFRSSSKGVSSGGNATTTSNNTDSTSATNNTSSSEAGGDHFHTVFGVTNPSLTTLTDLKYAQYDDMHGRGIYVPMVDAGVSAVNLDTKTSSGNHSHLVYGHSHLVYGHSHGFDFTHNHDQIYAVYQSTIASNISIYINGTLIGSGLNGDIELDIKSHLIIGQWNEVVVTSQTNGRCSYSLFTKTFDIF